MEKKKLYLLMQAYPVKHREASFIVPELPYLKENFDVTIVPLEEVGHSRLAKAKSFVTALCSPLAFKAAAEGAQKGKNPLKVFAFSYFMLRRARLYADYLKRNVFEDGEAVVYCYWFNEIALSGLLLKDKFPGYKYITRCHGYDVFDYRVTGGHHPYKELMEAGLEKVIFACQSAKDYYLSTRGKQDGERYPVCFLGVKEREQKPVAPGDILHMVSCSNVIGIKRVDMIVNALSLIDDIKVQWTHFGDGKEFDGVKTLAKDKLKKNTISCNLKGRVPNEEYMQWLARNPADLFITTSSTEGGVPVSLMEAASCGIPLMGTDAGGIAEIVSELNGTLLPVDTTPEQIAQAIREFYNLSLEEKAAKGESSYKKWQENYDCRKNSLKVIEILNKL